MLQKWTMKPKTELRKRKHRLLKGHATIEIWYNGRCLGTVTGADGPGVRVISQYPLVVREGIGTITQAVEIGIKTSEEN